MNDHYTSLYALRPREVIIIVMSACGCEGVRGEGVRLGGCAGY